MVAQILDYYYDSLPDFPYCTDDLQSGLMIRDKETAAKKRYLQHNSPFDLYWFCYDIDRPMATIDWEDVNAPTPTITVTNPDNGHAHLLYGLDLPVIRCEWNPKVHKGFGSPIRYAAAVDVAMNKKLNSDRAYAGLISKNPLHTHWKTTVWRDELYTLGEMSAHLDLEPYKDKRCHLPPEGLGRNCTVFDLLRKWAYKEVRKKEPYLSMDLFVDRCIQYAAGINQSFPAPLPYREVRAIGKSIGRWVYKKMDYDGFIKWCRLRAALGNRKSQEVRKKMAEERNARIIEYKQLFPNISYRELAKIFDVSLKTIDRIKELKVYSDRYHSLSIPYPTLNILNTKNIGLTSDIGKCLQLN